MSTDAKQMKIADFFNKQMLVAVQEAADIAAGVEMDIVDVEVEVEEDDVEEDRTKEDRAEEKQPRKKQKSNQLNLASTTLNKHKISGQLTENG